MSNIAIDLSKTVKEIITTMKTAIDNLNTSVATNKTAIDNLKNQILNAVYPVGSVYVSITDSRNPADILGFGTWEALPAGYGLVAQGTATAEDGSTLTFTAGQKSGEFKHQITVGELPTESPYGIISVLQDGHLTTAAAVNGGYYEGRLIVTRAGKEVYYGGGKRIDSISPAVGAYLWHRTV
jgi:hypothetical protein